LPVKEEMRSGLRKKGGGRRGGALEVFCGKSRGQEALQCMAGGSHTVRGNPEREKKKRGGGSSQTNSYAGEKREEGKKGTRALWCGMGMENVEDGTFFWDEINT